MRNLVAARGADHSDTDALDLELQRLVDQLGRHIDARYASGLHDHQATLSRLASSLDRSRQHPGYKQRCRDAAIAVQMLRATLGAQSAHRRTARASRRPRRAFDEARPPMRVVRTIPHY